MLSGLIWNTPELQITGLENDSLGNAKETHRFVKRGNNNCKPSIWEAEARGLSCIQGQLEVITITPISENLMPSLGILPCAAKVTNGCDLSNMDSENQSLVFIENIKHS